MEQVIIIIGAAEIACLIFAIIKEVKNTSHDTKMFSEQFDWYRSYYGEENAIYLIKQLRESGHPYKALNDLMKDINPELVNKRLSDK